MLGINPQESIIPVFDAQFCDSNFSQVFCSTFASNSDLACTARLGSPITCGDDSTLAGFLITDRACSITGDRFMLHYHSVSDFSDWIEKVSGAQITAEVSVMLILSAVVLGFRNFM